MTEERNIVWNSRTKLCSHSNRKGSAADHLSDGGGVFIFKSAFLLKSTPPPPPIKKKISFQMLS